MFQSIYYFVQLGFNLSNGVTDTLESSTILIFSRIHISLYAQSVDRMPCRLNGRLKVNECQKQELWIKSAVAEQNCELIYNEIFCADANFFYKLKYTSICILKSFKSFWNHVYWRNSKDFLKILKITFFNLLKSLWGAFFSITFHCSNRNCNAIS